MANWSQFLLQTAWIILPPLLGLWVYKRQTRINAQASKDQAAISAEQTPLQVLTAALAARDAEIAAMHASRVADIKDGRRERERLARTLGSIASSANAQVRALDLLSNRLAQHEVNSAAGRSKLHEKLEQVASEVNLVKDRLGRPASAPNAGGCAQ